MQLQSNKSLKQGYTIIEILIVLVIMSLFLGFGYARYRDFAIRQEVDIAVRQLSGDLRQAQSSALTGSKPSACSRTLLGYSVNFTGLSGPPAYSIMALCENPLVGGPPVAINIDNKTLNRDIVLSISSPIPTPPYEVIFRPVTLGTNLPANNSMVINVRNANSSASRVISISSTGEIK